MALKIPSRVAVNARKTPQGAAWLERLPEILGGVEKRWSLTIGTPFDNGEASCAWVAPATLAGGTCAVLKLGMPHMEGEHEIHGLRFWDGDPTVRLMEADDDLGAMLLERCEPGTALRTLPEPEQDLVIAGLLRRLWRAPSSPHPFRPLAMLMKYWRDATLADIERWPDPELVREGLRLFEVLPGTAPTEVLLATDLHAGNVLQSKRKPWLVIDPKPFVGDPAYDSTQHLFNCDVRLRADPHGTIRRMADLLGLDPERIQLWTFARAAAEPRKDWSDERRIAIARAVSP
jgi:streptomycin 6-kinase